MDDDVAQDLARMAREHVAQEEPEGTLVRALELVHRGIPRADHVSSTLVTGGRVRTAGSTHAWALAADRLQYELGEGPCLCAADEEQVVALEDLGRPSRFPRWSRAVTEQTGVRAVASFHLYVDDGTLGALNLYSVTAGPLDDLIDDGRLYAAQVAIALDHATRTSRLREGLTVRTVVGQAEGVLMERFSAQPDEAAAMLADLARERGVDLLDVAHEVVATAGHAGRA